MFRFVTDASTPAVRSATVLGQQVEAHRRRRVVPEGDLAARYHDRIREGLGVRFIEPETTGFDPARVQERVEKRVDSALSKTDATAEQKIRALAAVIGDGK